MATEIKDEPKVEMSVQTENTPVPADNSDLDICIGNVQLLTEELRKLRADRKTMEYELERLNTANTIKGDLIALLRKHLFWQNDMDLVQLIDETVRG